MASESPALSPCDLNAGPRYRCGRITVPSVRGDPSAGDQSIFFAVRTRDRAAKPPVGTIVAVEGGPGYASTNFDSAKSYRAVFGPLLRRRDLVLIDQRGTGHSQAVDCPQLQRGMVPELIAVGSCANQLGTRYQGFTSAESAADIEAVRTALGLGPITLYGDSYGTLLGAGVLGPLPVQPALGGALVGLPGQRSVLADDLLGGDESAEAELRPKLVLPRDGPRLSAGRSVCAVHGTPSSGSAMRSLGSSAPAVRSMARSPTCSRQGPGRRTHIWH